MADTADSDRLKPRVAATKPRSIGWTFTILFVFLAVIAGFAVLIAEQMQSVSRATDLRAFQRLAITAQSFASWPSVAEQVGRRSLPVKGATIEGSKDGDFTLRPRSAKAAIEIVHPQFGHLPLQYYRGKQDGCVDPFDDANDGSPAKGAVVGSPANRKTMDDPSASGLTYSRRTNVHFDPKGIVIWGPTMTFDPEQGELARSAVDEETLGIETAKVNAARAAKDLLPIGDPAKNFICYHFGPIPYGNALSVPDGFQALLLFDDPGPDGTKASQLVAHVGPDILPVRDASDIPDLQRLLRRIATQPKPGGKDATSPDYIASIAGSLIGGNPKSEFLTPLDVTIAGRSYRLYVYPISFTLGAGETKRMLIVGATLPQPSLVGANLNTSRFALLGLLLLALLVLTPFVRIVYLGPVDGLKPFELMVLAAALAVGTAITATIVSLAFGTVVTKRDVDKELQSNAATLAGKMELEIFHVASCPMTEVGTALRKPDGGAIFIRTDHGPDCRDGPPWTVVTNPEKTGPPAPPIAHPDIVVFMDKESRPPWDGKTATAPIVSYTERPGPFYQIQDRLYFSRANNRDVVAGTDGLAKIFMASLGLPTGPGTGTGSCDGPCGIAIEQILSRGDGIAKTMLSLPLKPRPEDALLHDTKTRAVAIGFVMKSMLAPALPAGVHYSVVDLSQSPELPSIFHSDPERANSERFSLSLDEKALARFRDATNEKPAQCATETDEKGRPRPKLDEIRVKLFSGRYIGEDQRFAVALVPCTEWAVVTFASDAVTDFRGAFPAEVAFLSWLGLALPCTALFAIGLMALRRMSPVRLRMLWPDPLLQRTYFTLTKGLAGFIAFALLIFFVPFVPTWVVLLSIPMACIAGIGFIFWRSIGVGGEIVRTRKNRAAAAPPTVANGGNVGRFGMPVDRCRETAAATWITFVQLYRRRTLGTFHLEHQTLSRTTEIAYMLALGAWLLTASALPVALIAVDAYGYQTSHEKAETKLAKTAAAVRLRRQLALIYKSQFPQALVPEATAPEPAKPAASVGKTPIPSTPVSKTLVAATEAAPDEETPLPKNALLTPPEPLTFTTAPHDFTADLFCLLDDKRCSSRVADGAPVSVEEPAWAPEDGGRHGKGAHGIPFFIAWGLLAIAAGLLPLAMGRILCRSLLGFGVPLEAVIYPKLSLGRRRMPDRSDDRPDDPFQGSREAPKRAILVAGSDDLRNRMTAFAGDHVIDLFEEQPSGNRFNKIRWMLPSDPPAPGTSCPLVVVHNLELLLRDDIRRTQALKLLEDLVREQDRPTHGKSKNYYFRLILLADISPLDRFLQAAEWQDANREKGKAGSEIEPVENIRWSRLLENFTTYTGQVQPRAPDPASKLARLADPKRLGVEYLLRELAYLPDRVVQALLPDKDDLTEDEIRKWGRFLVDTRPEAIADFLASQLIEHYHYLWSISSRAEQILIHRMANGELPIIRRAYALRSLVRRGIVVLDPAPRLMNHSFARFVRSVERPELLRQWMREAPQGGWTRIHGGLTIVLPLVLLLCGVLVVRGMVGLEAAVPLIAAASSALLRPLFSGRREAV